MNGRNTDFPCQFFRKHPHTHPKSEYPSELSKVESAFLSPKILIYLLLRGDIIGENAVRVDYNYKIKIDLS